MDSKVYELLNDQINKELYSAYLYLSFADYYADEGLDGYENWYLIQAAEERDHALIFRKYLLDNDCKVELKAIDQPDKTFKNHLEPLEAGLNILGAHIDSPRLDLKQNPVYTNATSRASSTTSTPPPRKSTTFAR